MSTSRKKTALFAGLLLLLLPLSGQADGNPERGMEKAKACEACHGSNGKSIEPTYPNLAGQYESYLIKALSDYRSGARTDAIMKSFAVNLSNQDIEDLAAWYASQEGLDDLSGK
jgi:cytochrome c553